MRLYSLYRNVAAPDQRKKWVRIARGSASLDSARRIYQDALIYGSGAGELRLLPLKKNEPAWKDDV